MYGGPEVQITKQVEREYVQSERRLVDGRIDLF